MAGLAALVEQFGFAVVVGLLALSNAGRIASWAEGVLGRVLPHWAAARKREAEREERVLATEQRHYLDTVLMLKDLLLEYRKELDDSKMERRQLTNRLHDIVAQYERHDARFIEVIRDMSAVIRGLTVRVERIERILEGGKRGS